MAVFKGAIKRLGRVHELSPEQAWALVTAWESTVRAVVFGSDLEFQAWGIDMPFNATVNKKVIVDAFRERAKALMRTWVDIKDELENFEKIQSMPEAKREYHAKHPGAGSLLPSQSHVDHPRRMGIQFWTKALNEALTSHKSGLFYGFMKDQLLKSKVCWFCRGSGRLTKPKAVVVPVHTKWTDPDPDFTYEQTGRTQILRCGFEVQYKSDTQVCPECEGKGKKQPKVYTLPRMLNIHEMCELLGIMRAITSIADYEHVAKEHDEDMVADSTMDLMHNTRSMGENKTQDEEERDPNKLDKGARYSHYYATKGTVIGDHKRHERIVPRIVHEPDIICELRCEDCLFNYRQSKICRDSIPKQYQKTGRVFDKDNRLPFRDPDQFNLQVWDDDPWERMRVSLFQPKGRKFPRYFLEDKNGEKSKELPFCAKGKGWQLACALREAVIEDWGINPVLIKLDKWAKPLMLMEYRVPLKDQVIRECIPSGVDKNGNLIVPSWARYLKFTVVGNITERFMSEHIHQAYATHKLMWGNMPIIWYAHGMEHTPVELVLDYKCLKAFVIGTMSKTELRREYDETKQAINRAGGRVPAPSQIMSMIVSNKAILLRTQLERLIKKVRFGGKLPAKPILQGLAKKLGLKLVKHEFTNPRDPNWKPDDRQDEKVSPDPFGKTVAYSDNQSEHQY